MKTFKVKVGTRNRITVPYDCWMSVRRMSQLKLSIKGSQYWWDSCVGMTPSMSYRVAVPFNQGTELELIPVYNENIIKVKKVGPYFN